MPSKGRMTVTLQLYIGQDDALIRWVESITLGTRSAALKRVLCNGLNLPELARPAAVQPTQPGINQTELIEALQAQLDHMRGEMAAYIDQRVNSLSAPSRHAPDEPHMAEAPRASADDMAHREAMMKKASW